MTSSSPLDQDLARLTRSASALRALVDEIDLGAADPHDLAPAVELVQQYLLGFLLPVLRDVVGPHLIATGAVVSLPSLHGPGEDTELLEALEHVRAGLLDATGSLELVEGARMLARSLAARGIVERGILAAGAEQSAATGALLKGRLLAAHPDLDAKRALADRLLLALEHSGFAA